ncbi:hypothetical protein ACLB2K_046951 [Fragaria x ananassa]
MSLTCSHQTLVLFSSNPPHTRLPKPYLFPTTSLLKLPPTLFRNGSTSVTHRNNRFQLHANSSDSDERQQVKPSSTSLLSFLCPLLKLFSGGDPSQERNFTLEVATSSLSTLARYPWGSRSKNSDSQDVTTLDPPMRLQLFEFEACPFCRRVREAMTELDLSAEAKFKEWIDWILDNPGKCADVPPFATVRRRRGHASTPADSSSFPDHFPSPASPPNSSFPARSPKTSNKVNLAGKLEFGGLAGDGKWSENLLESAEVEVRPRRCRTVAKEGRPHFKSRADVRT